MILLYIDGIEILQMLQFDLYLTVTQPILSLQFFEITYKLILVE